MNPWSMRAVYGGVKAAAPAAIKWGPRLWKGIQDLGRWFMANKTKTLIGGATLLWVKDLFDGDEKLAEDVAKAEDPAAAGQALLDALGEEKLEAKLTQPGVQETIFNAGQAEHAEAINELLLKQAERQDELADAQHEKALHQQMTPLQTLFTDPDLESKHTPSAMEGLRDQLKDEDKIRYEYDSRRGQGTFNKLTVPEQADMRRRWFLNNTGVYGNRDKRAVTSRDIGEAYREGPPTLDTPTGTSEATSPPRAPRSQPSSLDTPTPRDGLIKGYRPGYPIREPLTAETSDIPYDDTLPEFPSAPEKEKEKEKKNLASIIGDDLGKLLRGNRELAKKNLGSYITKFRDPTGNDPTIQAIQKVTMDTLDKLPKRYREGIMEEAKKRFPVLSGTSTGSSSPAASTSTVQTESGPVEVGPDGRVTDWQEGPAGDLYELGNIRPLNSGNASKALQISRKGAKGPTGEQGPSTLSPRAQRLLELQQRQQQTQP